MVAGVHAAEIWQFKCSMEQGLEESKAMLKAGGEWIISPATLSLLLANLTT